MRLIHLGRRGLGRRRMLFHSTKKAVKPSVTLLRLAITNTIPEFRPRVCPHEPCKHGFAAIEGIPSYWKPMRPRWRRRGGTTKRWRPPGRFLILPAAPMITRQSNAPKCDRAFSKTGGPFTKTDRRTCGKLATCRSNSCRGRAGAIWVYYSNIDCAVVGRVLSSKKQANGSKYLPLSGK